ncbi:helix-turn-helix transcriptional regulator [Duganella sp. FT3S]|uniref:Helix-turn-helix transcriptional regulator n=1 Tax=Rugamonas fusca TaxID=2758568 RepID=A0A7W2EG93_9BURK|nr:helix-turn-helix transcriptional regulator [Rugamonas fusca]MBA5605385.1 helix-turn-helix transcriptional regulator [Rugamonas fusca]
MARVSAKVDKDEDLVRFGASVRARRQALGLSQEALADLAGIDRSHMGKLERGERNLSFLNILRIANAVHCKPSDLFVDADL